MSVRISQVTTDLYLGGADTAAVGLSLEASGLVGMLERFNEGEIFVGYEDGSHTCLAVVDGRVTRTEGG